MYKVMRNLLNKISALVGISHLGRPCTPNLMMKTLLKQAQNGSFGIISEPQVCTDYNMHRNKVMSF